MQRNIHNHHKVRLHQPRQQKIQNGFIMLPVVLAITLIAAIAFLMNREGAMAVNQLGSEVDTTQASLVAKAGMNHIQWQANNSNCSGYSNLNSVNFGTNSYSASISPTSNSPVSIAITGTDANGASYTINRDRVKVYQPTTTVTLQLGTTPGKDALIASDKPTTNYGNGDDGVLNDFIVFRHQLIQFDLPSSIPTTAHIVSAQLQLYQKSAVGTTNIDLYRVKQSWVEGTKYDSGTADGATWNTYNGSNAWLTNGGDYDATSIVGTPVASGSNVTRSWEIASLVQDWLIGKYPNNGMLLKTAGGVTVTFASKEDTTAANRPKLIITYTCECGQVCSAVVPPQNVTLATVADTYLDENNSSNTFGTLSTFLLGGDTSATKAVNGLARFNVLAAVPPNSTITAATLRLFESASGSGGTFTVDAHRLLKAWDEATASWNKATGAVSWTNAGGDYDPLIISTATVNTGGVWVTWNVTTLVQEWVDGVSFDYGIALVREPGSGNRRPQYNSRENSSTSKPELVITYTNP